MTPSQRLDEHRDAVRAIARRHRAAGVFVFGSASSRTDRADSDLDLLVEPSPSTTLFDLGAIQAEVSALLGVHVDVVTPAALPEPLRRQVLGSARPV